MKRTFTLSIFFLLTIVLWSCSDTIELPDNLPSKPQSITGLRRVTLKENLVFGPTAIKGVVISDAQNKNIEEGSLIIQEESKDVAILLKLDEGTAHYPAGAEVEINLEGSTLSNLKGEMAVTNLKSAQVRTTGKTVAISAKSTNLPTLLLNASYWGPILVKLEKVEISGGINGKLSGELTLDDGIGTVFSTIQPTAVFDDNTLPPFVESYAGILRIQDEKFYINPRNLEDIQVGLKELLEDFEADASSNYDVKTLAFRTGNWTIDGGITAATAADLKTGLQSIRLQGHLTNANRKGIVTMEFDMKAVKTLKISHGIYPAAAETSNVNPTTLNVEISRDGGLTYVLLQQLEVDIKAATLKTDIIPVNAGFSENVRFRIVNSSTPFSNQNKPRINIDDVLFMF